MSESQIFKKKRYECPYNECLYSSSRKDRLVLHMEKHKKFSVSSFSSKQQTFVHSTGDHAKMNLFQELLFNSIKKILSQKLNEFEEDFSDFLMKFSQQVKKFVKKIQGIKKFQVKEENYFEVDSKKVCIENGEFLVESFQANIKGKIVCMFCGTESNQHCLCYKNANFMKTKKQTMNPKESEIWLIDQRFLQESKQWKIFDGFLALRHFKNSLHTCDVNLSRKNIVFQSPLSEILIKNEYQKTYLAGHYRPLVTLRIYEQDLGYWGRNVGIEASVDLEQNVFLGEYVGDLVEKKNGFLIKKPDSVFQFGKFHYIGPILNCGWSALMNHVEDCANVEGRTALLWGRPGIYFRTKRKIKKGEELTYDYGLNFHDMY